jgi:prepilin-type N-terminal cleavage/methylation domain-containing protein
MTVFRFRISEVGRRIRRSGVRHPPSDIRHPESGFTLVELMLAVLILAIIMSIIYGVVVSTVQAQQRVEEISQVSEIGPAILGQIREDLEGAFLPKPGLDSFVGIDRKGSTGDRDRLDFVTARMAYGSERDGDEPVFHSVNETGYQLLESKDDPNLAVLYRREDFFLDNEPLKGGRLTEIYDRVRHLSFEFWNGEKWMPDWSSKREKDKLPQAVKVELRILVTERDQPVEQTFTTTVTFPR